LIQKRISVFVLEVVVQTSRLKPANELVPVFGSAGGVLRVFDLNKEEAVISTKRRQSGSSMTKSTAFIQWDRP